MTFDYEADTPSTKALLFAESIQKYHYGTVIIEKTRMCLLSFVFFFADDDKPSVLNLSNGNDFISIVKRI